MATIGGLRVAPVCWRTSRYSGPAAACVQAVDATLWANGEITLGSGRPEASSGPAERVVLRPAGIEAADSAGPSISSYPVTPGAGRPGNGSQRWKESARQAVARREDLGARVRERTGPRPGTATSAGMAVTATRLEGMVAEAVADAEAWLARQAARFPWQPPPSVREACLAQVRALADWLFPGGIASATIVDDHVVETEPSTRRLLGHPHADWSPVTDWAKLLDQIEDLGAGGAGLVVNGRPAGIGHAFTIIHTSDGVRIADPQNGGIRPADDLTVLPAPIRARALLITPTGNVTRPSPAAGPAATIHSDVSANLEALTDPASPHIGMHRPQGYGAYPPGVPTALFTPGAGPSSQPARPVPPAVAVVNAARQYVGHLRWRGGSAPSPRDGWQISQTIGGGNHVNDFARWIRGLGDMPIQDSTMVCHELIFFAAYQAGVIDLAWLRRVYAHAAARASSFYRHFLQSNPGANLFSLPDVGDGYGHGQITEPEVLFQSTLADYLAPSPRHRYHINSHTGVGATDIPAGHVILFDGINGHVALSLGTRDSRGYHQVISHWNRPQNIPPGPGEGRPTGFLQITTLEDLLFGGQGNNPRFNVIEIAAPPWASPATMVVAAARQLRGKLRWRGGYGADRSSGWRVSETTNDGFPNDMALWLHGKGPEPNEQSTMNCWDAVLFSAYRAGVIDKPWIVHLYDTAASVVAEKAFRYVDPRTNSYIPRYEPGRYGQICEPPQATFGDALIEGMASGPLQRYMIDPATGFGHPDIPAGYIIFMNGANGHVAISLGTRDAQGRLEVLNHWIFPRTLPNQPAVGFMQPTTIEEIDYGYNRVIEFAAPKWGAPTGGSSGHGHGGYRTDTLVYTAGADDAMVAVLQKSIAARQSRIWEGLKAEGQPVDEATLEAAYADDDHLRVLRESLDSWTRGAGGRGQDGLPISGPVPAESALPAPGVSPETTAVVADTAGAEGPAGGARKTVIGSDGAVWLSSLFSENQCVNVAVVWMGGG